ncbi:hypothetical protein AX17_002703 [Amanita inopinata Kibby_2008]|nr:hypothetical protein AX17_002703 [Amanita inopinata Kibby_2008]
MHLLPIVFVALLPLGSFAGKLREERSRHSRLVQNIKARNCTKTYALKDYYAGESFLNDWDFLVGDDPTHGNVNFLSKDEAIAKNLTFVQSDGATVLAVDNYSVVPEGAKRDSVRIQSKKTYNGGLFVADFRAMPHGCGVWPAYWSLGPNWPNAGEIDILEGVHDQPTNQYTLHSSEGCKLSTSGIQVSSSIVHDICGSSGTDNRGCGFLDGDTRSYGHHFNLVGGGVFVHLWDSNGIKMWHFARPEIPADITARQPNPDAWGSPVAFWSSKTCDFTSHFFDHILVLDTTICGDWAGPSYESSGCPGTCAKVVANATNFNTAKWQVNYIAIYE